MQQTELIDALPTTVWKRRWTVLKTSLVFCAIEIAAASAYAIYVAKDNPLLAQITIAVITFATAAVLGYVFGASYDDKNLRDAIVKIGAGAGPAPPPAPPAVSIYPAAPGADAPDTSPAMEAKVEVIKTDVKKIKKKVQA